MRRPISPWMEMVQSVRVNIAFTLASGVKGVIADDSPLEIRRRAGP